MSLVELIIQRTKVGLLVAFRRVVGSEWFDHLSWTIATSPLGPILIEHEHYRTMTACKRGTFVFILQPSFRSLLPVDMIRTAWEEKWIRQP